MTSCRHGPVQDKYPIAGPYQVQLVALGDVDSSYIKGAAESIQDEFGEVQITYYRYQLEVPDSFLLVPGKYDAGRILDLLRQYKPDTVNTFLGVTGVNIANKIRALSGGVVKKNWSILGYGSMVDGVCVCSYKRMPQMPYFKKLVIHELGHTLGLSHCKNNTCTMTDGDGSSSPLIHSNGLCDKCKKLSVERILNTNKKK